MPPIDLQTFKISCIGRVMCCGKWNLLGAKLDLMSELCAAGYGTVGERVAGDVYFFIQYVKVS